MTGISRATGRTQRRDYSFDQNVGIPATQERDLARMFENFHLDPETLEPQTIQLTRRFFNRTVSNILYFQEKVRDGRQLYWWLVGLSAAVAIGAPYFAMVLARTDGDSPGTIVAAAAALLSGFVAGWRLVQELVLSNLRLNEWRKAVNALRRELYRVEGKRRADVEARARLAQRILAAPAATDAAAKADRWNKASEAERALLATSLADPAAAWEQLLAEAQKVVDRPGAFSPEREALFRDELQAAITAAEAIVEAEAEAHFTAIYDAARLTKIVGSVPDNLGTIQTKMTEVAQSAATSAQQRAAAEASDRKLERLERIRDERLASYAEALAIEMSLTHDKAMSTSEPPKPADVERLGDLIAAKAKRIRLKAEIDQIETEWTALRKLQRDRAA